MINTKTIKVSEETWQRLGEYASKLGWKTSMDAAITSALDMVSGEPKFYAFIQNGYAVHGVGRSEEECLRDAKQNCDWNDNAADYKKHNTHTNGDYLLLRCTPRLYAEVLMYGGEIKPIINDKNIADIDQSCLDQSLFFTPIYTLPIP